MSKSRIIVTGGLGFIGANLVNKLLNDFEVLVIDNGSVGKLNLQLLKQNVKLIEADLQDKDLISQILNKDDLVIHLAAKGNVVESVASPIDNFQSNVVSTLSLLEAMRKSQTNKIIFASTGGALMGNSQPPVNEYSCPKPISPYGASKLACEGYINAYSNSYNFKSIIFRFGNVYGPYSLHKKGVINKFIINILNNKKLEIFGSLETSRDYIHVDDICSGIKLGINKIISSKKINSTFHLANGKEVRLKDLIDILTQISNKKIQTNLYPYRKGEVLNNCSDFSLAKDQLEFEPKINLEVGLSELYSWIDKNLFYS